MKNIRSGGKVQYGCVYDLNSTSVIVNLIDMGPSTVLVDHGSVFGPSRVGFKAHDYHFYGSNFYFVRVHNSYGTVKPLQ